MACRHNDVTRFVSSRGFGRSEKNQRHELLGRAQKKCDLQWFLLGIKVLKISKGGIICDPNILMFCSS